ncbi:acetyltransferase [Pseudobutyrivibrio sp.]|uniref:acetyltransferase n=1 Tax=Pseudobutyrivibrio sp. TaxID=2014367 RepID=UPI0025E53527|nr:acetyltransferase [Pseudobutyrivibrio sp.]MBR5648281.1 acetyltransferase [Pseudobutyrivibrio sp.]
MNKLLIIGASGHGKVLADIALKNGYREISFIDDDTSITAVGEYAVIGTFENVFGFDSDEYDIIVGIGNAVVRARMQKRLEESNYNVVSLIHPNAVIAHDVKIGIGTAVMAGAVINSGSTIGRGCIINTSASVDHDNIIGDFVHISVAAHTAGTVTVGDNTWVGIGATVINNINITRDVMIGAGAVVVKDIIESGTYIGVPAVKI